MSAVGGLPFGPVTTPLQLLDVPCDPWAWAVESVASDVCTWAACPLDSWTGTYHPVPYAGLTSAIETVVVVVVNMAMDSDRHRWDALPPWVHTAWQVKCGAEMHLSLQCSACEDKSSTVPVLLFTTLASSVVGVSDGPVPARDAPGTAVAVLQGWQLPETLREETLRAHPGLVTALCAALDAALTYTKKSWQRRRLNSAKRRLTDDGRSGRTTSIGLRAWLTQSPPPTKPISFPEWVSEQWLPGQPHVALHPSSFRETGPLPLSHIVHALDNDLRGTMRHDMRYEPVLWWRSATAHTSTNRSVQLPEGCVGTPLYMHQTQRPPRLDSNGKLHALWVCSAKSMTLALKAARDGQEVSPDEFWHLGKVCVVYSTSIDMGRVIVYGRLAMLPYFRAPAQPCMGESRPVVTALLSELHPFLFPRSALLAWQKRLSLAAATPDINLPEVLDGADPAGHLAGEPTSSPGAPALALLGAQLVPEEAALLSTLTWEQLLGDESARRAHLLELESLWRVKWLDDHVNAYLAMKGPFSALHCGAGVGKTMLLCAVAAAVHAKGVAVWYCAPSRAMRREVFELIKRLMPNLDAVVLGTDLQGTDYFEEYLKAKITEQMKPTLEILELADRLLAHFGMDQEGYSPPQNRKLMRVLLAIRHRYMWGCIYSGMVHHWHALMKERPPMVVSTIGYLLKFLAGRSPWSKWPALERHGAALIDEYHQPSRADVVAVGSAFQVAAAAGDHWQGTTRQRTTGTQVNSYSQVCGLSTDTALQWTESNVSAISGLLTSLRFRGPETISMLHALDKDMYGSFSASMEAPHALVFPCVFQGTIWQADPAAAHTKNPMGVASRIMLQSIAMIVWCELSRATSVPNIAVVTVYRLHLAMIRAFLIAALPAMPHPDRETSPYYPRTPAEAEALLETPLTETSGRPVLRLYGPQEAGGITAEVVVAVAGRRRIRDPGWAGLMLEPAVQFVMLTRHSRRVHLLINDMTLEHSKQLADHPQAPRVVDGETNDLQIAATWAWDRLPAERRNSATEPLKSAPLGFSGHWKRVCRWTRLVVWCRAKLSQTCSPESIPRDLADIPLEEADDRPELEVLPPAFVDKRLADWWSPPSAQVSAALRCIRALDLVPILTSVTQNYTGHTDVSAPDQWSAQALEPVVSALLQREERRKPLTNFEALYGTPWENGLDGAHKAEGSEKEGADESAQECADVQQESASEHSTAGHGCSVEDHGPVDDTASESSATTEDRHVNGSESPEKQCQMTKWAEDTLRVWRRYVVNAVTVHVKGIDRALVELPIMQPPKDCKDRRLQDINTFIHALAWIVWRTSSSWAMQEGKQLAYQIRRHKAWVVEADGHCFWHKACHSERPAFCITDAAGQEVLHFYCAMGADLQHRSMFTPLARIRNSQQVFAAFLGQVPRKLPVDLQPELFLWEVPETQQRKGTPEQVQKGVQRMMEQLDVFLHPFGTPLDAAVGVAVLKLAIQKYVDSQCPAEAVDVRSFLSWLLPRLIPGSAEKPLPEYLPTIDPACLT
jgi:hypothetical protein